MQVHSGKVSSKKCQGVVISSRARYQSLTQESSQSTTCFGAIEIAGEANVKSS